MTEQQVLECRGLSVGYGAVEVARDIDFAVPAGHVLALLGPNGAGKTTLLTTLAGLLPQLAGHVVVEGEEIPPGRPRTANKCGVVLVPDDRALFAGLTVRENLRVASSSSSMGFDEVVDIFPALARRDTVAAGDLSGGEQQMLAVARALVQNPKVLLIDEMSMGLAPVVVEELLPVVRRIADEQGAVVVLVEQHVHLALEVADDVVVLVHGEIRDRGPAEAFRADPDRLQRMYLGSTY
ncbi:MAG TPA: ATP-binding cassette domain-containing protein [Gordonia sp. (in: high G+C Gram-positive bacteria)]|uniref:ABC transporter ATP-binding protein n=2 Tax=unclassified Gordonia (in: high G+C Gram-positive bacteria) TaxID=2657482 RepID=UPI000FBC4785|nr:ATP-binding cassette domain-containing protein [Gordonia sp. (in: high G+C Gram-positive bacteria)]RUP39413.1 MAG: ATP-binding cassette domain-containing protein [Gordonia sp. (in: high G+C Gram-positive bacteria)]HNP56769.1 ATP-binding cassette domain-containing protein [Gordonia sp. (in: high G+C Gram-positive bacteria)]HRC49892.1 ATP-binding cassette domain-containing protein [Gordonia sp. (in: high G+C Gram-positive bacteria)]